MDGHPECFRNVLKEFRAADASLTSQLKLAEEEASARRLQATANAQAAEDASTAYYRQIQGDIRPIPDFRDAHQLSPDVESNLGALKSTWAAVQSHKQELNQINHQLRTLQTELQEALSQEKQERELLERKRR